MRKKEIRISGYPTVGHAPAKFGMRKYVVLPAVGHQDKLAWNGKKCLTGVSPFLNFSIGPDTFSKKLELHSASRRGKSENKENVR